MVVWGRPLRTPEGMTDGDDDCRRSARPLAVGRLGLPQPRNYWTSSESPWLCGSLRAWVVVVVVMVVVVVGVGVGGNDKTPQLQNY